MIGIIQARTSSKRLKNKVLFCINGRPIIDYVYKALKKSKELKKIIVATSLSNSDAKLVSYLKENNIHFYRGSLKNVAKRLHDCAFKNKSKYFVRISADSPFIDYKIINRAIRIYKKNKKYDIITNVFPRSFPKGLSVELIKTHIIKKNLKLMNHNDKEHVTSYFYRNSDKFNIYNFKTKKKFSQNLVIDTLSDLKRLKKKFNKLYGI